MFALPGIAALIVFLIGRPFELLPELRGVPLLYLFAVLALFGLFIDWRVRFTELRPPGQFGWTAAFAGWCCLSAALAARVSLVKAGTTLATVFLVYALLALGVRSFKGFQLVAAVLLGCALWICLACVVQSTQPTQCVAFLPGESRLVDLGHPDGRACSAPEDCGESAESSYGCEHVGWLGSTTVNGRVRYVGTLQDPNEVALFVSAALPLAFAFYQRRPSRARALLALLASGLVSTTVYLSQSRGGLLVLFSVFSVYAIQRWGARRVFKLALLTSPLLMLWAVASSTPGAERLDAEASTLKRLGCMLASFDMFGSSPWFGVGFSQFTRYHEQTAHNAYLLALAELGAPGLFLWSVAYYLGVKGLLQSVRRAEARVADVAKAWANALTTSLVALSVGVAFLSFTYHYVLWIFWGLAAALLGALQRHDRQFALKFGWRDLSLVLAADGALVGAFFLYTTLRLS